MALVAGDVAVDFVAKLDSLFKGLDKVAKRLDKLSDAGSIKISVDNRVFSQLERISTAVENISKIAEEAREAVITAFDAAVGLAGGAAKEIEKNVGRSVKKTEALADDVFTRFTLRVRAFFSNITPMAIAQLLGIAIIVERLVVNGFTLTGMLPTISGTVSGVSATVTKITQALQTMNLPLLLGVLGQVGAQLLTVTAVAGVLFGILRGSTNLFLRFLQTRPEGRLQMFVQVLTTLNRGMNELLLRSQRAIDQFLFIGTGMVTVNVLVNTLVGSTVAGLTSISGLVTPLFATLVFGVTLLRRVSTGIKHTLIRFRALAGDGRAQTMLFMQALRSLFPIMEELAKQAKPIARAIRDFARGGFDKRVRQITQMMNEGLVQLRRIASEVKRVADLLTTEAKRVTAAMKPVVDKGKEIQKTIGRKGARDAIDSAKKTGDAVKKAGAQINSTFGETLGNFFSLRENLKATGKILKGFFTTLGGFTRGISGKDSPFGILFDASRMLKAFSTPLKAIRLGVANAFGEIGDAIRDKLVSTFRDAEKPVRKAMGDMAVAGSNTFVNAFAIIANPIRALHRHGWTPEGFGRAGFAFGAAMGKTITSALSTTFATADFLVKGLEKTLRVDLVKVFQTVFLGPAMRKVWAGAGVVFKDTFAPVAKAFQTTFTTVVSTVFGQRFVSTVREGITEVGQFFGKTFGRAVEGLKKPFGFLRGLLGGLGRLLTTPFGKGTIFGAAADATRGRTGVAAVDKEERAERQRALLQRKQVEDLRAKQDQKVIQVLGSLFDLFTQTTKNAKSLNEQFKRTEIKLAKLPAIADPATLDELPPAMRKVAQFANVFDPEAVESISKEAKAASETANKWAGALQKMLPDVSHMEAQIRAAAKSAGHSVTAENKRVAEMQLAAAKLQDFVKPTVEAAEKLDALKTALDDVPKQFQGWEQVDFQNVLENAAKAHEDLANTQAAIADIEKDLSTAKGKDLRWLEKQRARLEETKAIEERAIKMADKQARIVQAEIDRRETLVKDIQKYSRVLSDSLANQEKVGKEFGSFNAKLATLSEQFGGAKLANVLTQFEETGKKFLSKQDIQIKQIEDSIRDQQTLRDQQFRLRKEREKSIQDLAKRDAIDHELAVINQKLRDLKKVEAGTQTSATRVAEEMASVEKEILDLRNDQKSAIDKALETKNTFATVVAKTTESFKKLGTAADRVEQAMLRSQATMGKAITRAGAGTGAKAKGLGEIAEQIVPARGTGGRLADPGKNPTVQMLKAVETGAISADEALKKLILTFKQEPQERAAKMSQEITGLFTKLRQAAQEDPKKAFDIASPETIEFLARLKTELDAYTQLVNKLTKGQKGEALSKEIKSIAGREIAEALVGGETDVGQIIERVEGEIARSTKKAFTRLRVTNTKEAQATVDKFVTAGLGGISDKVKRQLGPAADLITFSSPPKTGPLRTAILSLRRMGATMGEYILKGKDDLYGATEELLEPFLKMLKLKSPPKEGPLKEAIESQATLGGTIGDSIASGADGAKAGVEKASGSIVQWLLSGFAPLAKNTTWSQVTAKLTLAFGGSLVGAFQAYIAYRLTKALVKSLLALTKIAARLAKPFFGAGLNMAKALGRGLMSPLRLVKRQFTNFLRKAIGTPLDNLFTRMSRDLRELELTANRLRMRPDDMKRFQEAISLLGGSAQDADTALMQLTQNIDRAMQEGPAGELADTFNRAGMSLRDIQNMSPQDIFLRLSKAINETEGDLDSQSRMLRLMGGEFTKMRGIILEGTDALQGAFEEVAARPPLTDDTLRVARTFARHMERLRQLVQRISLVVFEELAPEVENIINLVLRRGIPSIGAVLEWVRTGTRIFMRSAHRIVEFIRDRYVEAQGGLDNLLKDVFSGVALLMRSIRKAIKLLLDNIIPLVIRALRLLWFRISGQTRSRIGEAISETLGVFQQVAVAVIRLALAAGWEILRNMQFIALKFRTWLLNQLKEFLSGESGPLRQILEFYGIIPDAEGMIERINLALGQTEVHLKTLPGLGQTFLTMLENDTDKAATTIDRIFGSLRPRASDTAKTLAGLSNWLQAQVERNVDGLTAHINRNIARSEVEAAIEAVGAASDDAFGRAEALVELLGQADPEQAETFSRLIPAMRRRALAEIDPSLVGEEFEEASRAAFERVANDHIPQIEEALHGLVETGKVIPGQFEIGAQRLAEDAAKAFDKAGDALGEAFRGALHETKSDFSKMLPEISALMLEIGNISEDELADLNRRVAELMAQGVEAAESIKRAIEETNEEAKATAELARQMERRAKMLETVRFGQNLARQFRDMQGEIGPFEQAQRALVDNANNLEQALIDLHGKFKEIGDDSEMLIQLAETLGVDTKDIATWADLWADSVERVERAQKALAAAIRSGDAGRIKAAEDELRRAQTDELDLRERYGQQVSGIKTDIGKAVEDGFREGAMSIKKRPYVELIRNHLVAPVVDGFKETIRGIVDGSLRESARAAEKTARETGQKFNRVLFMVSEFGQRIFDNAFNNLLDRTMNDLTEGLSSVIGEALVSDDVKKAAGEAGEEIGDATGKAIGAALQAAIAVAGLLLSRLQSEVKASRKEIENIVESTEAVRGVISGQTTVAIKEVQDTLIAANRPITVRLDELIRIGRNLTGGPNVPYTPMADAGGTSL